MSDIIKTLNIYFTYTLFFILFCNSTLLSQSKVNHLELQKLLADAQKSLDHHKYNAAIETYKSALSKLSYSQPEYTETLLKIWKISQEHNVFYQDSIYFDQFNKCQYKTQNDIIVATCLYAYSLSLDLKNERALMYLKKIKDAAEKSKNAFFYLTYGTHFCMNSDYKMATDMSFKALEYSENNKDYQFISHIYTNLSRYFLHQSLHKESLHYAQLAIKLQKDHQIMLYLPNNYEVIMYLKSNEQQPMDSVRYYGQVAYDYAVKLDDKESQMYLLTNIATTYLVDDRAKSQQLMQMAENLVSEKTSKSAKLHFKLYKGNFEMHSGNYENAISIFIPLAKEYKDLRMNQEYSCYHYISYCYENLGNFEMALEYYALFSTTKSEFESKESKKSLLESELKYESEKKDNTILQNKLLLTNKENEAKLWSSLFKLKNSENKILDQNQKLAIQKNQNLNNQILLNEKSSKLLIAEKELAILNKDKMVKNTILIGILLLLILVLVFIYILWTKTKIQKNLETILSEGTTKMLQAKSKLDDFTHFVQQDKAIATSQIEDIKNGFALFEKTVSDVINDTQSYSFKISHEIQGPIKVIQSRLQNLSQHMGDERENDIREISEMVQKMQDVVDKLLLLTKIQKFDIDAITIDIGEQISDIIDDMQNKYTTPVVFERKQILPIHADPLLIRIMWENLISNSIKYHKKNNECRISVDSMMKDDKIIYTYEDNGAGMNKHYDHLNFSRNLNGNSNKIGLTLVHEIIKKHNGQFNIIKSDHMGTTFKITFDAA